MFARFIVAASIVGMTLTSGAGRAADYPTDVRSAQRSMHAADVDDGIRKLLPPGSPIPKIGPYANELEYIRWAQNSLSRGQDAEAELSLEWAQLRSRVDEEQAAYRVDTPPPAYDKFCERALCRGLRAIGRGQTSEGMHCIDVAIADVMAHQTGATRMASR